MNGIQAALAVASAMAAALGMILRICGPRHMHAVGTGFAIAGWIGAVCSILPTPLSNYAVMVFGVLMLGSAILTGALMRFTIEPHLLAIAFAAAIAFRVPMHLDGETYNLLLPLYVCIGVALANDLARAIPFAMHPQARDTTLPQHEAIGGAWRLVDVAVAAMAMWSCMSVLWAYDIDAAMVQVAMFIVPFAGLYVAVRDIVKATDTARHLSVAAITFMAVMTACTAIGMYQRMTQTIWQNPKVQIANAFAPDFRTNSLFWDPNIYGRYLIAALLVALVLLTQHKQISSARNRIILGGIVSFGLIGLWFTYSQSSMLALTASTVILSTFLCSRRALLALGAAAIVATLGSFILVSDNGTFNDPGRRTVATGGLQIAAQRPMQGLGIGSFPKAYTQFSIDRGHHKPKLRASHTTPITIVAELGLFGIAIYAALLAGCALAAIKARGIVDALSLSQRWAFALLAALFIHSLFYASFFEDPLTWVAAALLAYPRKGNVISQTTTEI